MDRSNEFPENTASSARDAPRHFHLLWDDDLKQLGEVLREVLVRRHEVVAHWYRLYVLHFGDTRSLSEAQFIRLFEPSIERTQSALLEGDMDSYASEVIGLGERLAERGVPVEEVIASLHLLEVSCHWVFPRNPPPPTSIYITFDKLTHIWIMLLVSAYMRSNAAVSMERLAALEREAAHLPAHGRTSFHGLVGESPAMHRVYGLIEAAGAASGNLLIVGESGTGKELVARAVHECGPRANRPFVGFNCAAIPNDLIESELFGYLRGAFSGAHNDYLGLFRAAEGGTLFLDEVTEMSADTQSKLLRAIQERAVRPVGATRERPIDVRLIASTNREPEQAVAQGKLRSDLYYRLQVSVLRLPPLRDRRGDIPLLVNHFIAIFNRMFHRDVTGIDRRALRSMQEYSWPGNVRELSNAIESAMTFGKSNIIGLRDLPATIVKNQPPDWESWIAASAGHLVGPPIPTFADAERELIRRALESTDGNKLQAARLLGISRKKLYAKIKQYKLPG